MAVLQDAPAHPAARFIFPIRLARLLEIIPTATVWLIITAPVWAALVAPAALGFGMILFSVYWLWKSLSFASGVLIGFWRLHQAQQRDWIAAARQLPGYDELRHLVIVPTCGRRSLRRSRALPAGSSADGCAPCGPSMTPRQGNRGA